MKKTDIVNNYCITFFFRIASFLAKTATCFVIASLRSDPEQNIEDGLQTISL